MKEQINVGCVCKSRFPCPPSPVFLQNDRSHPILLSSESTRYNHMVDDESVTLVEGIELSPAGGGISSLSSSNSDATKRQKVGGRMRGGSVLCRS